jgi:hypothetical protein
MVAERGLPMRRIREWGPLGHFRHVVTILAGNPKSQSSVLTLSLGQSLPPRARPRARPREAGEAGGEKLLAFVP